MMFSRSLIFLCALICTSPSLHAQTDYSDVKFGKVSAEDLALMVVASDSTAEAYTLYDKMRCEWDVTAGDIVQRTYVHRRVKLLRESSFERANVEVMYRLKDDNISEIKATIHLPDGESIQLKKRDIIREDYSDEFGLYKWTFPGVTEGAIIEYKYVHARARIIVAPSYYFQENIPVRWSEYEAFIPNYFNYISLGNAANKTLNEVSTVNQLFGSERINHQHIRWAYQDLPAYEQQPYVNNFRDYVPHVRFQLRSFIIPGRVHETFFKDWAETVKELDSDINFGRASKNGGGLNKVWKDAEPRLAGLSTDAEKAAALYNFVTGKISWNGRYSIYAMDSPNKAYAAAAGTSGEMTHMLLGLLRKAGIEAQPVLVGLRNKGTPVEIYPLITQFDHAMILANLDGESILLDPNDIQRPIGLPRVVALNHRAWVADPGRPRWINVEVPAATRTIVSEIVLDEDGVGSVDLTTRMKSYFAFDGRDLLAEIEGDEEMPVVTEIIDAYPDAELVSHGIVDEKEVSGPLQMNFSLKVPMAEAIDDYMYVQPVLASMLDEEMADVETRLYPVDFAYPWSKRYVANIVPPAGYTVEELPQNIRLISEDESIGCTFTASQTPDGRIAINFSVKVNRTVYGADEYSVLKTMFAKIIELQSSNIVLKRAK